MNNEDVKELRKIIISKENVLKKIISPVLWAAVAEAYEESGVAGLKGRAQGGTDVFVFDCIGDAEKLSLLVFDSCFLGSREISEALRKVEVHGVAAEVNGLNIRLKTKMPWGIFEDIPLHEQNIFVTIHRKKKEEESAAG